MKQKSLMQQALGEHWSQLPPALKAHYENDDSGNNIAVGKLSVSYPSFMQIPLNMMRLMGALLNQKGDDLPTTVERVMKDGEQYWHRKIQFSNNKQIHFKSRFSYDPNRVEFTEYTNAFLGLRMKVYVKDEMLYYKSNGYVLKLGSIKLSIPECLALGHASIIESAVDDKTFAMDFRLKHPLLGEIFSYKGEFITQ